MSAEVSLRLYETAQEFIADKKTAKEFVSKIEETIESRFASESKTLATKQDLSEVKSEVMKTIYVVGLIQFLAIVGSVLGIFTFMMK